VQTIAHNGSDKPKREQTIEIGNRKKNKIDTFQQAELKCFRLPARFHIYTTCCRLHAYAVCIAIDGVWTETRLLEPEEVDEWFADELNDKREA